MLRIRQPQMDALRVAMRRAFEQRQLARIAEYHADRFEAPIERDAGSAEPSAAQTFVRAAIDRAGSFGITSDRTVQLFIDIALHSELEFEKTQELSWTAPILASDDLTGAAKIELIYQRLS